MNQEIILNGMTREDMIEAREGIKIMDEGFEMLINQVDRITSGEDVPKAEIRKAKLKLSEGMMIFNDLQGKQEANQPLNRQARRNKKRGQR